MWVGACDSGVRRALPCSDLSGFALDDEWSAHTYDQPSSYERRKCVAELLPGSECAWPAAVDPIRPFNEPWLQRKVSNA